MDHHCVWINNCIGYNNYRTFLLMVIYLVGGCWFGIALLIQPFYEIIQYQIKNHGIRIFYKNQSGLLNLPMPMVMIRQIRDTGTLDGDVVIKLIFLLLVGISILLTSFLASHLSYVAKGVTTLEWMAMLHFEKQQASTTRAHYGETSSENMEIVNPFHQGTYGNIVQVFGKSMPLGLLPIQVKPLPPYILSPKKKAE